MINKLRRRKKPVLAAVLGALGPLGYFYLGWRIALCAWITWIAVVLASALLNMNFVGILGSLVQAGVFATFAYIIALNKNDDDEPAITATLLGAGLFPWLCTAMTAVESLHYLGKAIVASSFMKIGIAALGALILVPTTLCLTQWIAMFTTVPLSLLIIASERRKEENQPSDDQERTPTP